VEAKSKDPFVAEFQIQPVCRGRVAAHHHWKFSRKGLASSFPIEFDWLACRLTGASAGARMKRESALIRQAKLCCMPNTHVMLVLSNHTIKPRLILFQHYADENSQFVKRMLANQPNTHRLDIKALFLFDSITDELVQCSFVLSSTLQGIIFSSSYGIIPNAHMSLSNRIQGGEHKFKDYFRSVKRPFESLNATHLVDLATENNAASKSFIRKSLEAYDSSQINLMPFWQCCPIHAEAYNRTREQHLQFARKWLAKTFTTQVSENHGETFDNFSAQIEKEEFPMTASLKLNRSIT
jgi:hypothetical protein